MKWTFQVESEQSAVIELHVDEGVTDLDAIAWLAADEWYGTGYEGWPFEFTLFCYGVEVGRRVCDLVVDFNVRQS